MREIAGNLKQDVKDLLSESASTFSSFFKRGVCTVRAVADKWKSFAHDISDAVDTLMKPPFADGGPEAPAAEQSPEAEPIVTVVESVMGELPIGRQMTLSQANEEIRRLDRQYQDAELTAQSVKVKIDYTRDGQTDRYWLPLEIGLGGDLLEQMKGHLDRYRADPEKVSHLFDTLPKEYRETLIPFVKENLNELSTGLLPYFRHHCDISALEKQFAAQASILPEKEQQPFREAAKTSITGLRCAANNFVARKSPKIQKDVPEQSATSTRQADTEKPRQSVRAQLRQMKEAKNGQGTLPEAHVRHSPQGR